MKKSTIEKGLNPTKRFKIPAGWSTTRKQAYRQFRIEQYKQLNDQVPTAEETAIHRRKLEIIALHEVA